MRCYLSLLLLLTVSTAACTGANFSSGDKKKDSSNNPATPGTEDGNPKNPTDTGKDSKTETSTSTDPTKNPGAVTDETIPRKDPLASIDEVCSDPAFTTPQNIPLAPVQDPKPARTSPVDCRNGIEFNNLTESSFVLDAKPAAGSRAVQFDVDLATYLAPDRVRVLAVNAAGKEKLIFDSCRMSSWNKADPSDGKTRPLEETLRYYRPKMPVGTKSLKFDWSGAKTPTYFRIVGLCDFNLSPSYIKGAATVRPGTW